MEKLMSFFVSIASWPHHRWAIYVIRRNVRASVGAAVMFETEVLWRFMAWLSRHHGASQPGWLRFAGICTDVHARRCISLLALLDLLHVSRFSMSSLSWLWLLWLNIQYQNPICGDRPSWPHTLVEGQESRQELNSMDCSLYWGYYMLRKTLPDFDRPAWGDISHPEIGARQRSAVSQVARGTIY